jgi:hypothetical protein
MRLLGDSRLCAGLRRLLARLSLLAALVAGLLASMPSPPVSAAPDSLCEDIDPGDIRASARLTLELEEPTHRVTSSVTIDVPASSPRITQLLTDEPPTNLSGCLPLLSGVFDTDRSDYDAELDGDKVTIRTTVTSESSSFFYFDPLWSVSADGRTVDVGFNASLGAIVWHKVTIRTDSGLDILEVTPRPKVFDGKGTVAWQPDGAVTGTLQASVATSKVTVASKARESIGNLRILMNAASGLLVFAGMLYVFRRRRSAAASGRRSAPPAGDGDGDPDVAAAGRAVALAGLFLSLAAVRYVVATGGPLLDWAVNALPLLLLLLAAHRLGLVASKGVALLSTAVITAFAWSDSFTAAFALTLLGSVLVRPPRVLLAREGAGPVAMTATAAPTASPRWPDRTAPGWPLALLVGVTGLVGAADTALGGYLSPPIAVSLLSFAVLGVALFDVSTRLPPDTARAPELLVVFLAVAVVHGLYWSFPSYFRAGLPVTALLAMMLTLAALRRVAERTVLERVKGASFDEPPEQRVRLQTELLEAEGILRSLHDERRALDASVASGSLTAREKLRKERALQAHVAEVRRIPPMLAHREEPAAPSAGRLRTTVSAVASRMASWWGSRETLGQHVAEDADAVVALPPRIDPVDVALALGPEGSAAENARVALGIVLRLAVLPATYFVWVQLSAGTATVRPGLIFVGFEMALGEFAFWAGFGLAFGLLWSKIPGRRGSTKALLVTVPYTCVIALVWVLFAPLGEPLAPSFLLRGLFLLVTLLLTGLLMDLRVMRPAEDATRPALAFFATYYRLNRVIPTVTLLVPLIAAVVGIWGQIDKAPTVVSPNQDTGQQKSANTPPGNEGTDSADPNGP